jgi:ribosomal-protein-alanine N-acetyltransferase
MHTPDALPGGLPDTFSTARTRMRRPRGSDAEAVFSNWSSDPDVVRYLPWRRHESVGDAAAYLELLHQRWSAGAAHPWMITLPPDDDSVGLALIKFDGTDAEVGYSLARAAWGRGYMTEVCRELVRLAFSQPDITRVLGVVDVENVPSIRVLEKLGMRCLDTFTDNLTHPNISDVPRPCHRFGVLREAWIT